MIECYIVEETQGVFTLVINNKHKTINYKKGYIEGEPNKRLTPDEAKSIATNLLKDGYSIIYTV